MLYTPQNSYNDRCHPRWKHLLEMALQVTARSRTPRRGAAEQVVIEHQTRMPTSTPGCQCQAAGPPFVMRAAKRKRRQKELPADHPIAKGSADPMAEIRKQHASFPSQSMTDKATNRRAQSADAYGYRKRHRSSDDFEAKRAQDQGQPDNPGESASDCVEQKDVSEPAQNASG